MASTVVNIPSNSVIGLDLFEILEVVAVYESATSSLADTVSTSRNNTIFTIIVFD